MSDADEKVNQMMRGWVACYHGNREAAAKWACKNLNLNCGIKQMREWINAAMVVA